MTQRKLKHARALEAREEFLREERERGLDAQRKGREQEARRKQAKKLRLEREEEERVKQKKIDDDLTRLIAMMAASMRRFPTDKEVHEFIMGDDDTRNRILNSDLQGSK